MFEPTEKIRLHQPTFGNRYVKLAASFGVFLVLLEDCVRKSPGRDQHHPWPLFIKSAR